MREREHFTLSEKRDCERGGEVLVRMESIRNERACVCLLGGKRRKRNVGDFGDLGASMR